MKNASSPTHPYIWPQLDLDGVVFYGINASNTSSVVNTNRHDINDMTLTFKQKYMKGNIFNQGHIKI